MKVIPYSSKEQVLQEIQSNGSFILPADGHAAYGITSITDRSICCLNRNMVQKEFSFATLAESFVWGITHRPCGIDKL